MTPALIDAKRQLRVLTKAAKGLPAAQAEACAELIDYLHTTVKSAGNPVGTLALMVVGAELNVALQQEFSDSADAKTLATSDPGI